MGETRHNLERADRLEIELALERQARANREAGLLQERAAELGREILAAVVRVTSLPAARVEQAKMRLEDGALVLIEADAPAAIPPAPPGNGRADRIRRVESPAAH